MFGRSSAAGAGAGGHAVANAAKFTDNGQWRWDANPGRLLNGLHEAFAERLGGGRRPMGELLEAERLGAVLTEDSRGFHARNSRVAAECRYLLAFTWGNNRHRPKDGGTADTWNKAAARRNPTVILKHVQLLPLASPPLFRASTLLPPGPRGTVPSELPSIPSSKSKHVPPISRVIFPPAQTPPPKVGCKRLRFEASTFALAISTPGYRSSVAELAARDDAGPRSAGAIPQSAQCADSDRRLAAVVPQSAECADAGHRSADADRRSAGVVPRSAECVGDGLDESAGKTQESSRPIKRQKRSAL